MLFITLVISCCLVVVSASAVAFKSVQRIKAHVMIMYSGSGNLFGISDTYTVRPMHILNIPILFLQTII